MRRGAEQRIRKFLANAFKNDIPIPSKSGASTCYTVNFTNTDGQLASECSGFNVSFFDTTSKIFVGKTFRTEIGEAPFSFHAHSESISIVIESIRVDQSSGEEVVSCWWHSPLVGFLKMSSLKMYKGCGQQMYLDPSVWPAPIHGLTLHMEVTAPEDPTVLPSLLPPLICVREDFVDLHQPAVKPFRVIISRIQIQEQLAAEAGSLLEEQGLWSALLFAHNTHMLLSPVTEVQLTIDQTGSLVASKEISFSPLPVHNGTNLVCCLRFKKSHDPRFRPVGYTCFDLVTGLPSFSDVDANLTNLPFLRGPFSCEDPRCLSLENERPYALVPLVMGMRLSYFYTPIPAPIITDHIVASPSGFVGIRQSEAIPDSAAQRPEATAADVVPEKTSGENIVTKVQEGTQSSPLHAPQAAEPNKESVADINIYKLLCDIMAEVKEIKRTQDLNARANVPTDRHMVSSSQATRDHVDPSSPEMSLAAMTASQRSVGVQELNLRPVAMPRARQAAITEGMQPFTNPQTQQRLQETTTITLPGDLPNDQLIIRFEGITYGVHGLPMPPTVAVATSYSALPQQFIGPMHTRKVAAEDDQYGPSYQLAATDRSQGMGYMWFEPEESATNTALKVAKNSSNIYLHLYDASTMFYMASAILKPNKLQRSANALMTSIHFDLSLFEDLSMTEREVPDKVPLIASTEVGYLHLTAALLGIAKRPLQGSSSNSENENALKLQFKNGGANGKVIFVKKLPADFGGEHRQPTGDDGAAEQSALKPIGFDGLTDQRANLHRLRANFVRNLLQDKDTNALAVHINGGKIPTDSEHKLRYVEKRRDEVKSTKIAEALRDRITVNHSVTAWLGAPRVISTLFANPFPMQTTFQLEIPPTSNNVSLHPDTSSIISLGPHQETTVKVVIRVIDPASDRLPFTTQVLIRTMHKEVTRILRYDVSMVLPVVNRRFDVYGSAGETITKRIHSRAFPTSPNVSALGAMCHYCSVIGPDVQAETRAVVEPLTPALVAAWEEVVVTLLVPREGSRKIFVILYNDAEMVSEWETWEISITAVQRFETREVFYGQTSIVALPVLCDRAYSSDPNVIAIAQRDCIALKAKPAREGVSVFHVQAAKGQQMERIVVAIPCVLPTPSYQDFIDITYAQSGSPIYRMLTFTNSEPRQKVFSVFTNYRAHIKVTPEQFALAPMEQKKLRIEIAALNYLGTEGRWPMWIFINDAEDMTVESYLITVTVRATNPPITSA